MEDNRDRLYLFLIPLICLVLIILWFWKGTFLASAESALPFYNLSRYAEISRWAWAYPILGNVTGIHVAGYPTYLVLSIIQNIGVPGFLIEALVFFIILSVAGVSVYKLTFELFPQIKSKFALLAAIFYLFNPFFMINVWNRFLYDYMFFTALMPLALYFFIRGLQNKKYYFGLVVGLTTGIFSYSLASVPFNLILISLFVFTTVFYTLLEKDKKRIVFYLTYLTFVLVSYFLINFWWISQLIGYVRSSGFAQSITNYFSQQGNLSELSTLSESLGKLVYTSRFFHATAIMNKNSPLWSRIYSSPPLELLEFVISGVIFWAIYKKREMRSVLYLGCIFLVGLFLVKGNQPPFGEIFEFLFLKFTPLQVFRNPFEKFGFLLPIAAAPLFAFGISNIVSLISSKRLIRIVISGVFGFMLIVWGFPFWTGYLFTLKSKESGGIQRSYGVMVPEYYKEIESWLKGQGDTFRLVALPMGQEGITYDWQEPYLGVELTNDLISVPSISYVTTIPFYEAVASKIQELFIKNKNIDRILDTLNVRYILLRPDIAWKERGMKNPAIIESTLSLPESGFKEMVKIGKLSLWENTNWNDRKFYAANELVSSLPTPNISDLNIINAGRNTVLYNGQGENLVSVSVIHPSHKFYLPNIPSAIFEERQDIFPHVSLLPSSQFYPFIILKEKLENTFYFKDPERLAEEQILLLGKRLNESKTSNDKGDFSGVVKALSLYQKQLSDLKKIIDELNKAPYLANQGEAWRQEELYMKFARHIGVLDEIATLSKDQDARQKAYETKILLAKTLSSVGISTSFGYMESKLLPVNTRVTYQFNIQQDGYYELLIDISRWKDFYNIDINKPITFQVDKDIVPSLGKITDNGLVSFGKYNFSRGVHEIGLNTPDQANLVNTPIEFQVRTDHGVKNEFFEIKNYDPHSKYEISFDYRIVKGSGLVFLFENDNNPIIDNVVQPSFARFFGPDSYDFDFIKYVASIGPYPDSTDGKIGIEIKPWNDCEKIFLMNKSKCKDGVFANRYDRTTQVIIKNLKVNRVLTDEPVLISTKDTSKNTLTPPDISYQKINPTLYRIKVSRAVDAFNLIFSELYNSGWQAKLSDGTIISSDKHFLANAFGNGWLIDKKGDFEIEIKYTSQDILSKAKTISLVSFIGALFALVIIKLRKKDVN